MTNTSDDEYEYRETGMWVDGELVPVVAALRKPQQRRELPPLPVFEPCRRGCPDGECYCGEPMLSDFPLSDEDENGREGDYE